MTPYKKSTNYRSDIEIIALIYLISNSTNNAIIRGLRDIWSLRTFDSRNSNYYVRDFNYVRSSLSKVSSYYHVYIDLSDRSMIFSFPLSIMYVDI